MKGLIRNNFYSMESNIRVSFLIALFLSGVSFFVRQSALLQMLISMQLFVFIANTGTSLHADTVSKWSKFERTLPVKPREVILAKYLSFAALFLFGAAMGSVTAAIALARGSVSGFPPLLYGYTFGLTLSAVTVGIMFPLMLRIGTEKNELILILSAAASIGLLFLVSSALAPLTGGEMNLRAPLVGAVCVAAAFAVFVGSYFISVRIYMGKEFS